VGRVLGAVRYLLDRLSGPRTRADELRTLRLRLLSQARNEKPRPAEQQLARRLRELREQLARQLGHVEACARCADPPSTVWRGGQCCSARTENLYSDAELAALRLAGTTASRLKPPRGAHAGCSFRGPAGCSLAVADRPCVCVGYACRELLVELRQRDDAPAIARLQDELGHVFQRFAAERASSLQAALFDELEAGLLSHRDRER
jgi:hypothetical protein